MHVVFIYTCSLSYYGEPPYQTGNEVCAACPQDRPYCVSNLCCKYIQTTKYACCNIFIYLLFLVFYVFIIIFFFSHCMQLNLEPHLL